MVTDAAGQVAEVLHVPNRASKGKTGGRTIPLHPDLQAVLVTLQTARGDMASPERSILFSERGGGYRHLPDPPRALRRRVAAVRIGGWVVIEDADFSSLRAVEATHPLAASPDRHLRELLDRLTQAQLADPYLGSRVRGLLEDAGLTEIDNEGMSRIARGGETEARMLCMTLQALVERGILSAAAYSDIHQALLDPSFSFITLTTFAAWGKRVS